MTFGRRHRRIIEAMGDGWVKSAEVGEALEGKVPSIGQHLAHMARRGWVERDYARKGRWRVTERGHHLAEMDRLRRENLGIE